MFTIVVIALVVMIIGIVLNCVINEFDEFVLPMIVISGCVVFLFMIAAPLSIASCFEDIEKFYKVQQMSELSCANLDDIIEVNSWLIKTKYYNSSVWLSDFWIPDTVDGMKIIAIDYQKVKIK